MSKIMINSGIPWIGEIPNHWGSTVLLRLLKCRITDGPHETPVLQNTGIPFISVDSLNETDSVDLSNVKRFISRELYDEYQKKAQIEKGDILFSKAATIGKTAIVKDEEFMVWSPLAIIKSNPSICHNKYLYYILNCQGLIIHVSLLGTHNTQINVGMRALEKAKVPLPPFFEQQAIADFLDKKCCEIDDMISLQEKIIAELKSYKQSVISEVVCRGLNQDVPQKNSGIEWIGHIPSHWSLTKIKHKAFVVRGGSPRPAGDERFYNGNVPFMKVGDITKDEEIYVSNCEYSLKEEGVKYSRVVKEGTLLLTNSGATLGVPKITTITTTINDGIAAFLNLSPDIDSLFLFYVLKSLTKVFLEQSALGIGQPNLNTDIIGNTIITLPNIEEQKQIVAFLKLKCSEIDSMIALKNTKINALKEYKQSIIYEYITGKKEVPL